VAKFGIVVPFVEEHNELVLDAVLSIMEAIDNCQDIIEVIPMADKNRIGVPKMLNKALKDFKHDYFGYFGADDTMLPNAFKNLENFNGDWCYGDCIQVEDGNKYPYYAGEFNYQRLKEENFIPAGSVFVKTEILKEIRFNEKLTFAEDWELWLQIGKRYKPYYINQFQYNYSMDTSVFNKSFIKRFLNKRKFR